MEDHYWVTFDYDTDMLAEKEVDVIPVADKEKLKKVLEKVLPPLGLTFEKYQDSSFLVYPATDSRKKKLKSRSFFFKNLPTPNSLPPFVRRSDETTDRSATLVQNIKGRVTDLAIGGSLPGMNILVKGTGIGTVTDIDGNYQINSIEQALSEQIAGVQLCQNGAPGSGPEVLI